MLLKKESGLALACLGALASWLALGITSIRAEDRNLNKYVRVSVSASAPDAGGKQFVNISFDIDKGWYIYANPVNNRDVTLQKNQMVVAIKANGNPTSATIQYPAGHVHKDTFFGDYMVYEGKGIIRAIVQRTAGTTSPLEIGLRVNTCSVDGHCLPPSQASIFVR